MLSIAAVPAGRLADRIGIKKVAGVGAIIIVIGTVMRGLPGGFPLLLAATLIYGFGIGCTFPNLPKLVRACNPREQALFMIGILVSGVLLAGAFALSLTIPYIFPITSTYNGVFYIWSLPPLIATILWWIFIKEPPCVSPPEQLSGRPNPGFMPILKNPYFWLIAITFLLHNFFLYAFVGGLPSFLVLQGASPTVAGYILTVTFLIAVPTVILIPWFSSKANIQRKLFIWIPSILLIYASWQIVNMSLFLSWLLMLLVGIAVSIRFITLLTMPVEVFPREQAGTASGLTLSVAYVGAVLGPVISGIILNSNGTYNQIFMMLLGISAATVITGLFLPGVTSKPQGPKKEEHNAEKAEQTPDSSNQKEPVRTGTRR
jgi:CP family cyanate transporter-like MFS transporter